MVTSRAYSQDFCLPGLGACRGAIFLPVEPHEMDGEIRWQFVDQLLFVVDAVTTEDWRLLFDVTLKADLKALDHVINRVRLVVNVTGEAENLLLSLLGRLFLTLSILELIDKLDAEELLNHILGSTFDLLISGKLKSRPEGRQESCVALFGILLFIVPMVISLIELRISLSHGLDEAQRRERFSLVIKVRKEHLSCLGHRLARV